MKLTVIDLGHDRTDHRTGVYADPAAHRTGVFAVLEDHELSAAEKTRAARAEAARGKRARRPGRIWLPQDILRRATALYKRFVSPEASAAKTQAAREARAPKRGWRFGTAKD